MKLNEYLFMLILICSLININVTNSPIEIRNLEPVNDVKRTLNEQTDNYIIVEFDIDIAYGPFEFLHDYNKYMTYAKEGNEIIYTNNASKKVVPCTCPFGTIDITNYFVISKNTKIEIHFNQTLKDLSNFFHNDENFTHLISANFSHFDTSSVTNMNNMFKGCISLKTLDLSNFNTSSVTSMAYMFAGCRSLHTLDLSNFNTSSATDMNNMFVSCSSLKYLIISNFNFDKVWGITWILLGVDNLQYIDIYNIKDKNNVFKNEINGEYGLKKKDNLIVCSNSVVINNTNTNYSCCNIIDGILVCYNIKITIPMIQTTIPMIQTTIPMIQTTIPKIQTTIPIIHTTIPQIQTTIPMIQTTIPKIQTTMPIIHTTIPKIQTTIPIKTTIPHIKTTIPLIQTTVPLIKTTIPQIQTTIPQIQTTIPRIQTTIPYIKTTIPIIKTTIPIIKTTIPIIKTTIPQIQTTIPIIQTTIPLIQTTIPMIQTTIPQIQTTIPIIKTTIPIIKTTIPLIQTTIPIIQTTFPQIKTTIPLIKTTVPQIQTTIPLIQTTIPIIKTTVPLIRTTIPIIKTTIPQIQTTTPLIQTTIPQIKKTNPMIQTSIPIIQTTIPRIQTTINQIQTTFPQIKKKETSLMLLGFNHFKISSSNVSFNVLFTKILNEIYSRRMKVYLKINYNERIRILEEKEVDCYLKETNNEKISSYFCETDIKNPNIKQVKIIPKFKFENQNINIVDSSPIARKFMDNLQDIDDKYDNLENSFIYILDHSLYYKYSKYKYNITGIIDQEPISKLENKNINLMINLDSETEITIESNCTTIKINESFYSLICEIKDDINLDLKSGFSSINDEEILIVNFDRRNSSITTNNTYEEHEENEEPEEPEKHEEHQQYFPKKKSSNGLNAGKIVAIILPIVLVLGAIIGIIIYLKNKKNHDKNESSSKTETTSNKIIYI